MKRLTCAEKLTGSLRSLPHKG